MTDAAVPVVAGPVRLRIPPDPTLSRVLRLTVGAMASIGTFTLDEIDDVKIAMSEVLIVLIEHGDQGDIEVELTLDGLKFTIAATTDAGDVDLSHPDLMLCRTVLEGVSVGHSIEHTSGCLAIRVTLCATTV